MAVHGPAPTTRSASAYAALAAMDPGTPLPAARWALVRRLAEVTRADHVRLWLAVPDGSGHVRSVMCWPPDAVPDEETDPAGLLRRREDVAAVAVLRDDRDDRTGRTGRNGRDGRDGGDDDGPIHTVLTLASHRRIGRRRRRELTDTANCLMTLHRREELQTQLRRQVSYTTQLAGEVLDSSRRLAGVRELERRRVAAEVITFSRGRLTPLQGGVDRLVGRADHAGAADELDVLRTQLDGLITDFRSLVRGIHPEVLYRRGLRAALAEVAAAYPGQARISGSVPPRVDHEVAAALYYLTVAGVHALARSRADLELVLEQRYLDNGAAGLQVTLRAPVPPETLSIEQVRAALAVDADRLGTLGGWVRVSRLSDSGRIRVVAWVPDRLEPMSRAELTAPGSLHARVRAQALGLVARYAEGPGSARARRLLSRLDEPVQVAVTGLAPTGPWTEWITENIRNRPDLVLLPIAPGDTPTPAAGLPAVHGDLSLAIIDAVPDVVVRPTPGAPDRTFEVMLPGVGALRADVDWRELTEVLTTEVVAWADLLRARTALNTMLRLARIFPPPAERLGSLEQDLEELRIGAVELAELEARVVRSDPGGSGWIGWIRARDGDGLRTG